MRFISPPSITAQDAYDLCLNGVSDNSLHTRLTAIRANFQSSAADYNVKAVSKSLHLIPVDNSPNTSVVVGSVTKQELKDLYTDFMVGKTKPARDVYDKIRACAPSGKCPFCGMGIAYNVDHYLPKSKFPILSVNPANLVPSCRDCNFEKKNSYSLTAENQTLHPYFDHGHFIADRWVCAEVLQTQTVSVLFYANPPEHWDEVSKLRARAHFDSYELATRYGVESADQLTIVRDSLLENYKNSPVLQIQAHLRSEAEKCERINKNSWQTALHWALSDSEWYCAGGFKL